MCCWGTRCWVVDLHTEAMRFGESFEHVLSGVSKFPLAEAEHAFALSLAAAAISRHLALRCRASAAS
jgi:hypothetical protein